MQPPFLLTAPGVNQDTPCLQKMRLALLCTILLYHSDSSPSYREKYTSIGDGADTLAPEPPKMI